MIQLDPPDHTEAIVKRAIYKTFGDCSHVMYSDEQATVPAKILYSEDDVWENVRNAEDYGFHTNYYGCFYEKDCGTTRVNTNAILGFHLPLRFTYNDDGVVIVLLGNFDGFSCFDPFGDRFDANLRKAAAEFDTRVTSII